MTQLNIATTSLGWGELKKRLEDAKELLARVQTLELDLISKKADLSQEIGRLNDDRRARVLSLLNSEGRAICLIHKIIFRDSKPGDWLAPEDSVKLVRMVKSWRTNYRIGDGDSDWREESSEYDSSACSVCFDFLNRASFDDPKKGTHTSMKGAKAKAATCEDLYTQEVLDMISEGYYEMKVVRLDNIEKL